MDSRSLLIAWYILGIESSDEEAFCGYEGWNVRRAESADWRCRKVRCGCGFELGD